MHRNRFYRMTNVYFGSIAPILDDGNFLIEFEFYAINGSKSLEPSPKAFSPFAFRI